MTAKGAPASLRHLKDHLERLWPGRRPVPPEWPEGSADTLGRCHSRRPGYPRRTGNPAAPPNMARLLLSLRCW